MAIKKPLVISSTGEIEQLQAGDTVDTGVVNNQSFTAINGNAGSITIGMPVYISAAGTVDKARANADATSPVIGLVEVATIATTASGKILTDGIITVADWTSITGSATLTAGATYFLDAAVAGKLTATAPSTAGQSIVRVGTAIDTTTLEVSISRPIKL